jgi:antitoxin Phd
MYGSAVIFKDSRPEFVLTPVEDYFEISDDEKIDICARRILQRFKPAFEELAK